MTASAEALAPGDVQRPPTIAPADWARMPWPAKWKAARRNAPPRATDDQGDDDWHGTYAGYERHRRQLETPCDDCLDAMRAYHRDRRGQTRIRVRTLDDVLVDRFLDGSAHWTDLTVDERIAAARRLGAAGISRNVIAQRTHLNGANLRRAWSSSTGRVAATDDAAQDSRHAS